MIMLTKKNLLKMGLVLSLGFILGNIPNQDDLIFYNADTLNISSECGLHRVRGSLNEDLEHLAWCVAGKFMDQGSEKYISKLENDLRSEELLSNKS